MSLNPRHVEGEIPQRKRRVDVSWPEDDDAFDEHDMLIDESPEPPASSAPAASGAHFDEKTQAENPDEKPAALSAELSEENQAESLVLPPAGTSAETPAVSNNRPIPFEGGAPATEDQYFNHFMRLGSRQLTPEELETWKLCLGSCRV